MGWAKQAHLEGRREEGKELPPRNSHPSERGCIGLPSVHEKAWEVGSALSLRQCKQSLGKQPPGSLPRGPSPWSGS